MDKQTELKELKNLGAASINILHTIGIQTLGDLQQAGAVDTYLRIKKRGIKVSKVMLYALEGALTNKHWKELNSADKERLLEQVQQKATTEAL